jgi:23S rRNA pseudouridine1911/1915/1917 synthase
MPTFVANAAASGLRLDVWLASRLGLSRSQIQKLAKEGLVEVNGKLAKTNHLLLPDDRVVVSERAASTAEVVPPELPIVYEDADILVVDKPAGLAVHLGNGMDAEPTVADFARPRTEDTDAERPGIVHRLDRETSGLLVIAKTLAAKDYLQRIWKEHGVQKTYLLLAVGRVEPEAAVINLLIGRDPGRPLRRAVVPGGKPAVTRYRTLAVYPDYTLIEAKPESGRTHQLRVHFAAVGHPVAGDIVYGPLTRPLGLKRQFLHAAKLELTLPSGRHLTLESPLPPELEAALSKLAPEGAGSDPEGAGSGSEGAGSIL